MVKKATFEWLQINELYHLGTNLLDRQNETMDTKNLFEPILDYCWLEPLDQICNFTQDKLIC